MAKKPFFTEGMTIEEIMKLGDDTLRQLSERDISRAVRTLSLAANKRFNRLLTRANVITNDKGEVVKFTERADKRGKAYGLDFNALYGYSSYIESAPKGAKVKPFGVTNVKIAKGEEGYTGALKAEFSRVRNFLQAGSTTIEGSVNLRQNKEITLFGQTREEKIQEMLNEGASAEDIRNMLNSRDEFMSDVYDTFHIWKERYALIGVYDTDKGKEMLAELGRKMDKGQTGEEAINSMENKYNSLARTEAEQAQAAEEARMRRLRGY